MANGTQAATKFSILQPIMQYGFAGMSAALLGVVVWMVHTRDTQFSELLTVQAESSQVIAANTEAINELARVVESKWCPARSGD